MKLHTLLIISFALGIVGCAEKEQAAPPQETQAEPAEAAVAEPEAPTEAPEAEEAPADEPDTTFAKIEDWRDAELLDHMHAHAEHLDDLNFALDDGNLEQAMTSANWIVRHDTVKGLPPELQSYVDGMREAAREVEAAEYLDTARAGAQKIGAQCQGCHTATGAVID